MTSTPGDERHGPMSPSTGRAVLHLFCRVGPVLEREAVIRAVKDAGAAGDQVVTVALLGHKADIGFMVVGDDLWRLRHFQTALAGAGLDVVSSYVSLTELSEYAPGLPDEMKQARLYPNLPPEGNAAPRRSTGTPCPSPSASSS